MGALSGIREVLRLGRRKAPSTPFAARFKTFKSILERNNRVLTLMADMGDKLGGDYVFDRRYIEDACEQLSDQVFKLISDLSIITPADQAELFAAFENIRHFIGEELAGRRRTPDAPWILPLDALGVDSDEAAGKKMAVLGEIGKVIGLTIPNGFVISTAACEAFMLKNDLPQYVRQRFEGLTRQDIGAVEEASRDVRERIMAAPFPRALAREIEHAAESLAKRPNGPPVGLALRSSAWEEDGESSFAGQYASILNVTPAKAVRAVKEVLAGVHSPEAWLYRRHRGFQEHETAMAVGCQPMIDSAVSGAMYSYAPFAPEDEAIFVSAAWGLCAPVVGGQVEVDAFTLERRPPFECRTAEICRKTRKMVSSPDGGPVFAPVPEKEQDIPCLTEAQLRQLGEAAMRIERYFKRPQDVEWTFDAAGRLIILQSRPIIFREEPLARARQFDHIAAKAETIFSGKGAVAQRGVAIGPVHLVARPEDLLDFPDGAILAARYTSPRFTQAMDRAHGILTEAGSPAGHMAAVAREFRLPTIVDCGPALGLLKEGEVITVDATQNVVYRGVVKELRRYELTEEAVYEDSYEYRLLRRLLGKIAPLRLVDPNSPNFRPSGCRTYHDITRYIHERAVRALIRLSENRQGLLGAAARKLQSDLPLGLSIIDLDDAPCAGDKKTVLTVSEVCSEPLAAFLDGLISSNMWEDEPVPVDMGSFMASVTRTFGATPAGTEKLGRNLALVSKEYMNLNLRLGYHFTLIDAYVGENINDNALYFRFMGGVTDFMRRTRRARCIGRILERSDFRVEMQGDLVAGRIKKFHKARMLEKVRLLGALTGFTRQLDVKLRREADVERDAEAFLASIKNILEERDVTR